MRRLERQETGGPRNNLCRIGPTYSKNKLPAELLLEAEERRHETIRMVHAA